MKKSTVERVKKIVHTWMDIDEDGCQLTTLNVNDLDSLVTDLAWLLEKAQTPPKTWSALLIAQSNGAYAGRVVKFCNTDNEHVHGVLTRSFHPDGSPTVLLTVASDQKTTVHTVGSCQMVEVA